jgi:hypothetical protein
MNMELCFESNDHVSIPFIRDLFGRLLETHVSVRQIENLYIISCNRNYDVLKKIKRGVYVQLNEYKYVFVTHYTPSKL